jgi:5-formyltetrahydrofolate cyclo-ligase
LQQRADQQASLSERKATLRAEASAARREVWLVSGARARDLLTKKGAGFFGVMEVSAAAGYFPVRDELDPLPLLACLHKFGWRTGLPVVKPGPDLIFREWSPGLPLERGRFKLRQPLDVSPELSPSIVLVPLLAFDRKGNRLGYGAGYYDAALRRLRRLGPVTAIGIGFDEQEFPEIPREAQDEPMDMILTPSRIIACGA